MAYREFERNLTYIPSEMNGYPPEHVRQLLDCPVEAIHTEIERTPIDQYILLGEASANSLLHFMVMFGGQVGAGLLDATGDRRIAHHAHEHARHVEPAIKRLLRELTVHKNIEFSEETVRAVMLFSDFHDWEQQTLGLHNLKLEEQATQGDMPAPQEKVHERTAHEIAGAIKLMALDHEYATVTGLSIEESRRILRKAALLMMRHDDKESVSTIFLDSTVASNSVIDPRTITKKEALLEAFEHDRLDLTRISPAQLMTIHTLQKEKAGTLGKIGTTWGFDPEMEREYEGKFLEFANDHNPLFDSMEESERTELTWTARVAYWADMSDMIAPYWDAVFRKIDGHNSRKRPFTEMSVYDPIYWEAIDPTIDTSRWGIRDPQKVVDSIMDPHNGHGTHSDVERTLWELAQFALMSKAFGFGDIPFVNDFTRENIIKSHEAITQLALMFWGLARAEYIEDKKPVAYEGAMTFDELIATQRATRRAGLEARLQRNGLSEAEQEAFLAEWEREINEYYRRVKENLEHKAEPFAYEYRATHEGLEGIFPSENPLQSDSMGYLLNLLIAARKAVLPILFDSENDPFDDLAALHEIAREVREGKPSRTQEELYAQDPIPKPIKITGVYEEILCDQMFRRTDTFFPSNEACGI